MAPIIYPRYHQASTFNITSDSAVTSTTQKQDAQLSSQSHSQPKAQFSNHGERSEIHNSDIAQPQIQSQTQLRIHRNKSGSQERHKTSSQDQSTTRKQTRSRIRNQSLNPDSDAITQRIIRRQLSLDVSTPTRASPSAATNAATATTRRMANPTFNDIIAPTANTNNNNRQAANPIRTTRSDNPTVVANLDVGSSTRTKSASKEEETDDSDFNSDTKSKSKSKSKDEDDDDNDEYEDRTEDSSSSFIRTTTVKSSSSPSSSRISNNGKAVETSSSSILNEAVATSNLSWWQLLAIIIGGILALSVGSWLFYRHRYRKRKEKQEKKKENLEDERKRKEIKNKELDLLAMGVGGNGGKFGHNRRVMEELYVPQGDGDVEIDEGEDGEVEVEVEEEEEGGKVRLIMMTIRNCQIQHIIPNMDVPEDPEEGMKVVMMSNQNQHFHSDLPLPIRIHLNRYGKGLGRKASFRDSVFSTYNSMKKAAVRLKYVEAKVKLDEQLEQEEKIENERKMKVIKANQEIEKYNEAEAERKATLALMDGSGNQAGIGAHKDLGPAVGVGGGGREQPGGEGWSRNQNRSGENGWSGGGEGQRRNGGPNEPRGGKLLIPPVPRQPTKTQSMHDIPTAALLPYHTSSSPLNSPKKRNNSLDGEISNLLGNSNNENGNGISQQKRPEPSRKATDKSDKRKGVLKNHNANPAANSDPSPSSKTAASAPKSDIAKPEPSYHPSSKTQLITQPRFEEPDLKVNDPSQNKPVGFLGLGKSQNQGQGQGQGQTGPKKGYTNPFQIDWLSRPIQSSPTDMGFGTNQQDQPSKSTKMMDKQDSIGVPIAHPNDRPVIPNGSNYGNNGGNGSTAGSVSQKGKGSLGFGLASDRENTLGGGGPGGNKWANRLRERR